MPRIIHPSIASLTAADGAFLRSLTLPGLKNMVLYGSTSRSQPDIYYAVSSLYNLIVHSACALSSLRIIISNCAIDQNLIHILEASPDLTSLGLEFLTWHGDSVQTIQTLFGRLGSFEHVLIPKLQSLALVLEEADFLGTNFGLFGYLFAYFVEDRWRKGTLRSVTVTIPWTTSSQPEFPLSQACRETLIKLENEGMDVEFISRGASLLL
ncbi:uncharacterized protein EV420DRAFT_1643807 [Desarmillaria tabescens]|uniref:Uncharacterized protein n=1 Tax=Armillaria tabescens TaxID=1929756 RepID=A0AA39N4U4_ARMTA|nr:uncharacterized protein EV420DRAFT_1643807 [Desarmillaria tabescens]KAK0457474.1 hypothetical protein EV420DRAFT_1643807 [Desarmillaria tabescens]